MTYATSNQPVKVSQGVSGNSVWLYVDGDAHASVDATDYFSDGDALGMKVGDVVIVSDTSTPACTVHPVSAVTAGGAATIGAGTFS